MHGSSFISACSKQQKTPAGRERERERERIESGAALPSALLFRLSVLVVWFRKGLPPQHVVSSTLYVVRTYVRTYVRTHTVSTLLLLLLFLGVCKQASKQGSKCMKRWKEVRRYDQGVYVHAAAACSLSLSLTLFDSKQESMLAARDRERA